MIINFIYSIMILIFTNNYLDAREAAPMKTEEATFAMGCFWCGESEFRDHETSELLPGIIDVKPGYTGGTLENPTYESHEGHKEGVHVIFDPSVISYVEILDIFWRNIDLFDNKGQFCDKGDPYKAVLFYHNETQKVQAEAFRDKIQEKLHQKILTPLLPAEKFWDAEEYHQNYKKKNPIKYKYYRWNCGRDQRLSEIWKNKK
jgi:peptide-methionine (S)-S-oxide reductase